MSAFAGSMKVRARLFRGRTVAPFVQAGIGMYRASFTDDAHNPPEFYQRRMSDALVGDGMGAAFTDPTVVAGGGVNFFVKRYLAIRPAADATIVFRDGRRYVVASVAVHAVFHFEDHPVTPRVR
jgi:hypothetical protein